MQVLAPPFARVLPIVLDLNSLLVLRSLDLVLSSVPSEESNLALADIEYGHGVRAERHYVGMRGRGQE